MDTNSLVAAANVMRLSNYQADPLAATMQTRSLGLSKLSVTKDQIAHDKELFSRSLKVKGEALNGLKIDTTDKMSTASSKMASPRILKEMGEVEAALYRKQISANYHTTVPKFMRSQGPFAVYDHSAHKGSHAHQTVGSVNEQALSRFN